jgi:hypothetical protein
LELTVTDRGGLQSTATCTVNVNPVEENDTTLPEIMIQMPASSIYYATNRRYVTLSGYASDNIALSKVTWISSRGFSGTASGTENWSIPVIKIKPNVNVITVTAFDAAGNQASTTMTVYLPAK